jgi:hypothetical protein
MTGSIWFGTWNFKRSNELGCAVAIAPILARSLYLS